MRIAVTGHRSLHVRAIPLIRQALSKLVAGYPPSALVGITCLADGADQLFADVVVECGGDLEVVLVPSVHRQFDDQARFEELLARARLVHNVGEGLGRADAWTAAAGQLLEEADLLVAVWDGSPATVVGSTADVVAAAHKAGIPVITVWPQEARRA